MKLEKLINEIQSSSVAGATNREIVGISCDSRQVHPGYIFIAVQGGKEDGLSYIDDAVARGAVAVVSSQDADLISRTQKEDICYIRVNDARVAAAELANVFNGRPSNHLNMIGITGTNGKTTIAYMVRDILRAVNYSPGLITTVEYEIGARVIPAIRTAGTNQKKKQVAKSGEPSISFGSGLCLSTRQKHPLLKPARWKIYKKNSSGLL